MSHIVWRSSFVALALGALVSALGALAGCDDGKTGGSDAGDTDTTDTDLPDAGDDGGTEMAPGEEFDGWCQGEAWDANLVAGTPLGLAGEYLGYYPTSSIPVGMYETMKIIPEHPFWVTAVRASFVGESGEVAIRLTGDFGRSYAVVETVETDLMTPIEEAIEVDDDPETWTEWDVSAQGIFLEPTQHYFLVNEQLGQGPFIALEALVEGDTSRALMFHPSIDMPYGSEGNFRMELSGYYFCSWDEAARWFGEIQDTPFVDEQAAMASISDLNGDGHDDLISQAPGPRAYFGDGAGGFSDPGFDPFPDAASATTVVFGDVDNDGDRDAFAGPYVGADDDGDGWTKLEGDCNDTNAAISPDDDEILDSGVDDDCDGVADHGTETSDSDGDTVTIAEGDCDDTNAAIAPGAAELLDGLDNDCDQWVDEDFVNQILLNDGTGHFTGLSAAGVEALDQSTVGAWGDGDADGFLDIYWGNWLVHYPSDPAVPGRYFEGVGDGTFVDAQAGAGLVLPTPFSTYGVIWNDWNNDGAQDIFVGNYHMYPNQLWENQGDGTFVDVAEAIGVAFDDIPSEYPGLPGGHTYGGDFGDVENDGDMDFYMANLAHPRTQPWGDPSMFVVNGGAPDYLYDNRKEEFGFIYDEGDIGATFADYDNDMDVDLVVTSLYPWHFSRLYRNDGGTFFTDVTYETNTAVNHAISAVWSDVDEDGDLDLFIGGGLPTQYIHTFENRVGQDNNWIALVLEGTTTNRDGIGARVTLEAGGVTQMRDVRGGGGNANGNVQSTRVVHFGLASESTIDSLTVRWVGGATETFTGAAPNGRYHVVEGSGTATLIP
ncbi:MAG: FG-GAP-like repeat-containing protein [Proteobacteria bacterium]|jgi:hypothetical protein|nr:FG-GAP-like repeat-containing protein [Pseudomonadota bacterium]